MASDIVLDLGKEFKGESRVKGYEGKTDILAWSWGLSNSGTFHTGSGGGAGKASVQDISITKYIDAASPTLMLYCANGKHIEGPVKLVCRKAGENPLEYLVIELTNILVSSYSTGGSGGEDRLTENLSLNFQKVKATYVPQNDKGGKGDPVVFGWDIGAGTKL